MLPKFPESQLEKARNSIQNGYPQHAQANAAIAQADALERIADALEAISKTCSKGFGVARGD